MQPALADAKFFFTIFFSSFFAKLTEYDYGSFSLVLPFAFVARK